MDEKQGMDMLLAELVKAGLVKEGEGVQEAVAALIRLMPAPVKEEPVVDPAMPPAEGAAVQPASASLTENDKVLLALTGQKTIAAAHAEVLRLRTVQPPMVDAALAEGRITPAQAKVLRPMEASAPDQLRAMLAVMPAGKALPTGGRQASGGGDGDPEAPGAGGVTPEIEARAKELGLKDPKILAASLARLQERAKL